MKKKATETEPKQSKESMVGDETASSPMDELLKNGTTVLTAKTRDELAEMVNDIPADVKISVGAVAHNTETGAFTLRVDITNN